MSKLKLRLFDGSSHDVELTDEVPLDIQLLSLVESEPERLVYVTDAGDVFLGTDVSGLTTAAQVAVIERPPLPPAPMQIQPPQELMFQCQSLLQQYSGSGPIPPSTLQFLGRLMHGTTKPLEYESFPLQQKALGVIPVVQLYSKAQALDTPTTSSSAFQRQLLVQLTKWFKTEFFKWVNNAPCDHCGSGNTKAVGMAQPTPEELSSKAQRVEVYSCNACQQVTRFPRYEDPGKLLETRRGRCGEWANCFTLCCIAVGLRARYVSDWTDHVWTEVWLDDVRRWVHVDPCENAIDAPLQYEKGWGKKLNYIISFGKNSVVDTTKRYTRQWDQVLSRRNTMPEPLLAQLIETLNNAQIKRSWGLSLERRKEHELHKASEEKELQATLLLPLEGLKAEEMQGRISGSTAWRSARGELGEEKEDTSGGSAGSSNGAAAIDVAALTSLAVSAIGKEGRRVEAARVCDNGALLAGACCSMEWLQWGSVPLVDGEAVLCCSSAGLTGQQLVVLTSRGRWLITNAIDAEGKEGRGPKWVEFKVDVRARINPVSTVHSNTVYGIVAPPRGEKGPWRCAPVMTLPVEGDSIHGCWVAEDDLVLVHEGSLCREENHSTHKDGGTRSVSVCRGVGSKLVAAVAEPGSAPLNATDWLHCGEAWAIDDAVAVGSGAAICGKEGDSLCLWLGASLKESPLLRPSKAAAPPQASEGGQWFELPFSSRRSPCEDSWKILVEDVSGCGGAWYAHGSADSDAGTVRVRVVGSRALMNSPTAWIGLTAVGVHPARCIKQGQWRQMMEGMEKAGLGEATPPALVLKGFTFPAPQTLGALQFTLFSTNRFEDIIAATAPLPVIEPHLVATDSGRGFNSAELPLSDGDNSKASAPYNIKHLKGLPNLTHCQVIMQEPNIKFNSLTAAIQAAASDLSEPQGTTTRTAVTTEDNAKAAGAGMFVSGGSHTFAAIGVADGTITCSGENQPNEGKEKLFDGATGTKWLDFLRGSPSREQSWIEIQLHEKLLTSLPKHGVSVSHYVIAAANDCPGRDPSCWELRGRLRDGGEWVTLHAVSSHKFAMRHAAAVFPVERMALCTAFQLRIPRNAGAADCTQLGNLRLCCPAAALHPRRRGPPEVTGEESKESSGPLELLATSADLRGFQFRRRGNDRCWLFPSVTLKPQEFLLPSLTCIAAVTPQGSCRVLPLPRAFLTGLWQHRLAMGNNAPALGLAGDESKGSLPPLTGKALVEGLIQMFSSGCGRSPCRNASCAAHPDTPAVNPTQAAVKALSLLKRGEAPAVCEPIAAALASKYSL